jgi:hypothetical protein
MKMTLLKIALVIGFIAPSIAFAQTTIKVKTEDAECRVALISDQEAKAGEYGWWSVWQELNRDNRTASTPTEFTAEPGTYTLVVYWENNNDRSDGIALEKIHLAPYVTSINYTFSPSDFTEWNCLSCPWLCIYDGKDYVKHSEVLKDVTGYENRTTTTTSIDPSLVIDGKLSFQIREEKDEISYIDQIRLKVGDQYLSVSADRDAALLSATDDEFLMLKKGQQINLSVEMPSSWNASTPLVLEVTGYYHPEQAFMTEITNKLLKAKP